MKFKKKAALIGSVLFLGLFIALPVMRDEMDWHWAKMRDQAADYMGYETDWPKGRHVLESRVRYQERAWKDSTRAMINDAIKKNSEDQADPDTRQERRQRLEQFLWKQSTNEDTLLSYRNYLQRYPAGLFAPQARRRIQDLERTGASTNAPGQ